MDAAALWERPVPFEPEKNLGDVDGDFGRQTDGNPGAFFVYNLKLGASGELREGLVGRTRAGPEIDAIARHQPDKGRVLLAGGLGRMRGSIRGFL